MVATTKRSRTADADEQTPAELLLEFAKAVQSCHGQLMIAGHPYNAHELSVFVLSLKFKKLGPAVHLRAIVEEWDKERIQREVYI